MTIKYKLANKGDSHCNRDEGGIQRDQKEKGTWN